MNAGQLETTCILLLGNIHAFESTYYLPLGNRHAFESTSLKGIDQLESTCHLLLEIDLLESTYLLLLGNSSPTTYLLGIDLLYSTCRLFLRKTFLSPPVTSFWVTCFSPPAPPPPLFGIDML